MTDRNAWGLPALTDADLDRRDDERAELRSEKPSPYCRICIGIGCPTCWCNDDEERNDGQQAAATA